MPIDDRDPSTHADPAGQEPAEGRSHGASPSAHRRRYGSAHFPEHRLPQHRPAYYGEGIESPLPIHRGRTVDNSGQGHWSYRQRARGSQRHFTGEVTYISGQEGERRRTELAAVLGKLLHWAAAEQQTDRCQDPDHRDAA